MKFQGDVPQQINKVFSPDALYLFLKICLPLMAGTMLGWAAIYGLINLRQKREREKIEHEKANRALKQV